MSCSRRLPWGWESRLKKRYLTHSLYTTNTDPVAIHHPDFARYPCSDTVRQELLEVISALPSNSASVVQVSEQSFAVFGLPTASNPLGFCHVKKEKKAKSGYCCTGKDCRSFASKAKGSKVKACCLHLHLLFATVSLPCIHFPWIICRSSDLRWLKFFATEVNSSACWEM